MDCGLTYPAHRVLSPCGTGRSNYPARLAWLPWTQIPHGGQAGNPAQESAPHVLPHVKRLPIDHTDAPPLFLRLPTDYPNAAPTIAKNHDFSRCRMSEWKYLRSQ
jgi:hypothetical protein